jgi:UDP-glucose 4-epimerase
MKVLVTGGAGYVGSHTCIRLLESGYEIIVVDNLSNSQEESINRVKRITGRDFKFYKADLLDKEKLDEIFKTNKIDAVIHFAGLKAVGESVAVPLRYYYNNVTGTLILCEIMNKYNVKNMIFSSSATVYGSPEKVPITEDSALRPTNPYGQTKLVIEQILADLHASGGGWNIVSLRYFNPIGAHNSGLIGENPNGIPNNLIPYITQVAVGKMNEVRIFGNNYPTHDGTGIRDYIHVMDLAEGHLKALEKLDAKPGIAVYNLGTGHGYSVLEMINAFTKVSGRKIPYSVVDRRPGDIAVCYADSTKAAKELGWAASKGLDEMCADSWRWQENNPEGYGG